MRVLEFLEILGLIIFYPFWVVLAVIKDILCIPLIPFDVERSTSTYAKTIHNIKEISRIHTYKFPGQSNEPGPEVRKPIGYEVPGYDIPGSSEN